MKVLKFPKPKLKAAPPLPSKDELLRRIESMVTVGESLVARLEEIEAGQARDRETLNLLIRVLAREGLL